MSDNSPSAADCSSSRRLWRLFWEFFKIASLVVGGGYAILVVADDVFGRKLKWIQPGELPDMLALIQTVPGLTAGNIAIYVGYRIGGFAGALAALTGVALPSFAVITLVAMGFGMLPMDSRLLAGAFVGVRTAMAALSLAALTMVWKDSTRDWLQWVILGVGVVAIMLFHLNPGWLIGGGLTIGLIHGLIDKRLRPKENPQC